MSDGMNAHLTRRAFVRRLLAWGMGLLVPVSARAQGKYVPVGRVGDFPVNAVRPVTLPGGERVFVRRLPGRAPAFHALGGRCTHKGCPVAWHARAQQFQCPCHGGKFDAMGKVLDGPPPTPLPSLPTKVTRGTVWVGI